MYVIISLYYSCDLHVTDYKGTTPLHWAAASNQMGIVQLLLRYGNILSGCTLTKLFHVIYQNYCRNFDK